MVFFWKKNYRRRVGFGYNSPMEIRIFWLRGLAAMGLALSLSLSPSAQAEESSLVAPSGEVRVAPSPAEPLALAEEPSAVAPAAPSSGEVRVAQAQPPAPSGGDGRPVTLGDLRWYAERDERRWAEMRAENERRWAEMRVEMNALRADLSNFKNLVITLLAGLLIAVLGIPWGPRVSHWMGREKSDRPDKSDRSDPAWKSAP